MNTSTATHLHATMAQALAALQISTPTPPASFGEEGQAQAKQAHTAAKAALRAAMAGTSHHTGTLALAEQEAAAAMARWQAAIETLQAKMQPVMEAFDASPESPVSEALTQMELALTDATAQLIGCTKEELQWHWLENNFGRRGLCIKVNNVPISVTSHGTFLLTIGFEGRAA